MTGWTDFSLGSEHALKGWRSPAIQSEPLLSRSQLSAWELDMLNDRLAPDIQLYAHAKALVEERGAAGVRRVLG